MSRLNRIHVAVIALIVFAGLAAAFLMVLMRPHKEEIAKLQASIDVQQTEANKRNTVEGELDQAKKAKVAAGARWNAIVAAKMSKISLADPYKAMFEIYRENQTYSDQIIAGLNADKDVKYTGNALNFPFSGWNPPIGAAVRRTFPQSGLTLQATNFKALLEWFKTTEKLPRIILLGDTITLNATSPGLAVSTPMTVYIDFKEAEEASATAQPGTAAMPRGASAKSAQSLGKLMKGPRNLRR